MLKYNIWTFIWLTRSVSNAQQTRHSHQRNVVFVSVRERQEIAPLPCSTCLLLEASLSCQLFPYNMLNLPVDQHNNIV